MSFGGTVTDIDGNVYETVQIGDQLWMAENLRVTSDKYGNDINYWYYDNDINNADPYGCLYNWETAINNLCMEGWSLPSDDDWKTLEIYLGMSEEDANSWGEQRGSNEGSKIAGFKELWNEGVLTEDDSFGLTGFNAIPGGYRHHIGGVFNEKGNYGTFHSSTLVLDHTNIAFDRGVFNGQTFIGKSETYYLYGISVRCIADEITSGCTNPDACNYDETANVDDGSCLEEDCLGECGGDAEIDECGVCGGTGFQQGENCDGSPIEFDFNQSTLQSFYFFQSVTIDSITIESDDWVAAFNGDKCVGSIKWNLNACNGICGVPAMGDDGSDYTDGYMLTNQNPTFKIYDNSENTIHDAYPSINYGFTNNGMFMIESLQNGDPTIDYCIPLLEGANLISFYALPNDPSLSNVLSPLIGNVTGVIGEGVSSIYNSTLGGWIGSLTEFNCPSGYWITVINSTQLCIENGMSCINEYHLYEGANLLSFPSPDCVAIGEALPDDMENYISGIVGEGIAATNHPAFGWIGSLSHLCGTRGYWFVSYIQLDFSFEIEPR